MSKQTSDRSDQEPPARFGEALLERALFGSRWILAPFYVGLVLSMAALLVSRSGAANAMTGSESPSNSR